MASQITTDDRLDGWDAISDYLGWHVRTVIRWEKQKGLPVHRLSGGKRQPVYAYKHEIDLWFRNSGTLDPAGTPPPAGSVLDTESAPFAGPTGITLPARIRSRWVNGKVVFASVALVCILLFASIDLWQSSRSLVAANPTRITRSQTRILSPLLSDGVEIFYPRFENGRYGVASVPVKGGEEAVVVTNLTDPELCDLALDGDKMLLRDLIHSRDEVEPLYVQSTGSAAQRVGNIMAYDAAWYPDSRRILFSADGVVYSTDVAGKSRRQLFSIPGNAFWFRWSPDGKRLRFTVIDKRSEETSIWEVSENGNQPHKLFTELKNHLCCGSWTANGRFYLFQARVESTFQIWAQQDRHSSLSPIPNPPFSVVAGAVSYRGPVVSKDGRNLFVRAEALKGELALYDSKLGKFVSVLPSISARTLAFSSDKQWIAYTSLADNNLWRCRADGTECLRLTQDFKNTVMPSWSPDGRTVAFMGLGFSGRWGIFAIPANGGPIRPLTRDDQAKGYPAWSPDGQRIAFSDVPPVSEPQGIYVLDLRSQLISLLPESKSYFLPRWSPDGRSILAQHSADRLLYQFEFASGKWRPLTDVPADYPNWSHDGRYVYFSSNTSDSRGIFRVAVSNRVVEKVASLAGVERGPFFMGDWVGLAPDDSPIAVRNSTIEDIYSWNLTER